jgi:double-stranded RNA-specific adenosine deaminase
MTSQTTNPSLPTNPNQSPIRVVEKPRVSTCAFADRVAQCALDAFRSALKTANASESLFSDFRTVLAAVIASDDASNTLYCVSLGAGTKILSDAQMAQDGGKGRVLSDMHGEVLARRGFVRVVLEDLVAGRAKEGCLALLDFSGPRPRFRDGISLHLYTSSAPCGNACVRKWAKAGPKETFRTDLQPNDWPKEPHAKFWPLAIAQGQCAVLCKIDPGLRAASSNESADYVRPALESEKDTTFPPPGAALPTSSFSSSRATCSDKVARWFALGLEGAIVRSLLDPDSALARPATVTVGRKFARPHLERAMCCRVSSFYIAEPHPSAMCTSLKLHEGTYAAHEGASFPKLAVVWRSGAEKLEVIDCKRGLLSDGSPSSVSRASIHELWLQAARRIEFFGLSDPSANLPTYNEAKLLAAPSYQTKVSLFLSQHLVEWPRRRFRLHVIEQKPN